jgi:hypothetical protein
MAKLSLKRAPEKRASDSNGTLKKEQRKNNM